MAEQIVLEHLRHIRGQLDQLVDDGSETRTRLSHLEEQNAHMLAQYATLSARLDRQQHLIERILKRLDLVDPYTADAVREWRAKYGVDIDDEKSVETTRRQLGANHEQSG